MSSPTNSDHSDWLSLYANNRHAWHPYESATSRGWQRRLGVVESSFDIDGHHFQGRADITGLITVETRSRLTQEQFRQKMILSWAALRAKHALLTARVETVTLAKSGSNAPNEERRFIVEAPKDEEEAVQRAEETIVFAGDFYEELDVDDFYEHCYNTTRLFDQQKHSAKLFILPFHGPKDMQLQFVYTAAHDITDGLTNYNWLSSLIRNINTPNKDLLLSIRQSLDPDTVKDSLPPAQEDLYPPIAGSRARQRWFWLLTRVFHSISKPLPAPFPNPLRRSSPRNKAVPFPAKYHHVLDYSHTPPLNTFHCSLTLSQPASARLRHLCSQSNTSIGAGLFALVALSMMHVYETTQPAIPISERRPFIATFPLNPRPFFAWGDRAPNSCMLAFSSGIVFPFLSREWGNVEGRFRVLAKAANRQLGQYQKRVKKGEGLKGGMIMGSGDATAARRLLAKTYVQTMERTWAKMGKKGPFRLDVEDAPQHPTSTATCGVSSVGNLVGRLHQGMHSLQLPPPSASSTHSYSSSLISPNLDSSANEHNEDDAIRADYRTARIGVRARDNEFLVGCTGEPQGMTFGVSFDGNVIDEEMVFGVWKGVMEGLLEGGIETSDSRL